jgi:GntR family transcriptional regulator
MPSPSISQKLHDQLGRLIAMTPAEHKLPSEPVLAHELGVSRATLREAMRTFETQGLIRRRQGSGTYVMRPSTVFDAGLEVLESLETLAERIGLSVGMGEHHIVQRKANPDELLALGLEAEAEVIQVSRVILAEQRPVAYLIDRLPGYVLTLDELKTDFSGSVLDLILKRGKPALSASRTEINAVTATSEVARALEIQRGDVLLGFTAYLIAADGATIDYSSSYFIPGYFHFHVNRRIGG